MHQVVVTVLKFVQKHVIARSCSIKQIVCKLTAFLKRYKRAEPHARFIPIQIEKFPLRLVHRSAAAELDMNC